jgi:adenylosuccinate lyase
MGAVWTDERKFDTWLAIEIAACEAWAELGRIPAEDLAVIKKKAAFDTERILEIEETTKHDVIAFLTNVAEYVGPSSRFIHMGLTSSDILDTSLALLLCEAAGIILEDLDDLLAVLKRRAYEFKDTLTIGRSHGLHAEPISFGHKLAVWYDETKRNRARLIDAKESIRVGKLSGVVGTFATGDPRLEEMVMASLGLKPAPASTQVVQRDRHAHFFTTLAIIASSIEKFSVEIRHLQRTEVLEAQEYFAKGQKGSSAMPHKRNPILTENLTGLARIVRANSLAALEDVALWHERDISHSSVERVIAPDSTILADFMLGRITGVIDKLVVRPENMMKNLNLTGGLIYSQRLLLSLIEKGMIREDAYAAVQRLAAMAWDEGKSFIDLVRSDDTISDHLSGDTLEEVFDPGWYIRHTDEIFARVFDDTK